MPANLSFSECAVCRQVVICWTMVVSFAVSVHCLGSVLHCTHTHTHTHTRGCIQKFQDNVDKEINNNNNNKHSLRSNTNCYSDKLTRLTHKIAIELHLVAESCTICSSRSRRPVRKLFVTPSYMSTYS
jgi:hypothetical protein